MQMDVMCEPGCRPAGQAFTVTSSEGNSILELNHQTALVIVSHLHAMLVLIMIEAM